MKVLEYVPKRTQFVDFLIFTPGFEKRAVKIYNFLEFKKNANFWNKKSIFSKLGMKIKIREMRSQAHDGVHSSRIGSFYHGRWLTSVHLNPKNHCFEENTHLCARLHVFIIYITSQNSNSRNFGSNWNFLETGIIRESYIRKYNKMEKSDFQRQTPLVPLLTAW